MNGVAPSPFNPAEVLLSLNDMEEELVAFLNEVLNGMRLDNPSVNELQQTGKFPKSYDPDEPPVPFDPTARAQTLAGKVPIRIVRGRVPRTVTGEINASDLPNVPNLIIQVLNAEIQVRETFVGVRILGSTYDENPDGSGYQDLTNIMERAQIAICSFGQAGIGNKYVIQLPFMWHHYENTTFPHFVAELNVKFEFPSGRPLPDSPDGIIPMEHIESDMSYGS